MNSEPITRRQFLLRSVRLGAIGACALAVPGAVSWLISQFPPPKTIVNTLGTADQLLHPAQWWQSACAGVQCTLCPFNCFIPEGMRGICNVRANVAGELKTLVYAQPVSLHVDPIEKKPFYHLYPGSRAFSVSTVGCNLNCAFCQNWEISQVQPEQAKGEYVPPAKLVEMAQRAGCRSIAYTYGEPTVFYEYMLETAKLARRAGLANVMVSAGYINWPPLRELLPYLDAVKIDLKGFNEGFYRRVVKGELRYVLRTLRKLSRAGMLTELVNLVVPTLNDNMDEIRQMCRWVVQNMGPDTPLSFSRFTPHYQLQNLPPTPVETLERAYAVGRQEGLNYVYVGNVVGHPTESTFCPTCNRVMIKRYGYAVQGIFMDAEGRCPYDGTKIYGKWG